MIIIIFIIIVRHEANRLAPRHEEQQPSVTHLAGCRTYPRDPLLSPASDSCQEDNGRDGGHVGRRQAHSNDLVGQPSSHLSPSNGHVGQANGRLGRPASFDLPGELNASHPDLLPSCATTRTDPQPAPSTPQPAKRYKRRLDERFSVLFGSTPSVRLPLSSLSGTVGSLSPPTTFASKTSDGSPSRSYSPLRTSLGQPLSRQALSANDGPPSSASSKSLSSTDGSPSSLPGSNTVFIVQRSPSPSPGPQPLATPLEEGGCRNPRVRQQSLLSNLPWYSSTPP